MKKNKIKAQRLCTFVIEHLPDSASLRRELLEGIIEMLPAADRVRDKAALMIHYMDQFDHEQKQMAFVFTNLNQGDGKGGM